MTKSIECKCTHSFTCGFCMRNRKHWIWTPSAQADMKEAMDANGYEFTEAGRIN